MLAAFWRPSGGVRGTMASGEADCGVAGAASGVGRRRGRGHVKRVSRARSARWRTGAAGRAEVDAFEPAALAACGLVGTAGMSDDSVHGLTVLADTTRRRTGSGGAAGVGTGAAGCFGDLAAAGESRSPNWLS